MSEQQSEEVQQIEKLYELSERLTASKDKSQNVEDYEGIIKMSKTSMKAKQLASQLIPRYFKFFPSLSTEAFNAHMDCIDDGDLEVRAQAIRELPLFCEDTPDIISKIVDVLVQLLKTEEPVERDAVHTALMSLLREDTKVSSTALFTHARVTPTTDKKIREEVLNFIRDKVFPLKGELLKPQEEMERHITDLIKQSLEDVTGGEFKMFMDFLTSLSIFGGKAPQERMQELVEIIEGRADLNAQFEVSDTVHIERSISCLQLALPFFERGAPSSRFLNYLNKHIMPIFDKLPEDSRISLVKSLTKIPLHTRDTKDMLQSIFSLLMRCMNAAFLIQEMDSTIFESILYIFHHLAERNPDQGRILCSPEALSLSTTFAELTKTRMARLYPLMTDLTESIYDLESEEDSFLEIVEKTLERDHTKTQWRACNNILSLLPDVQNIPLPFIGDINISWNELRKPSCLKYPRIVMGHPPPQRTHFEEKLKLDPILEKKLYEDGIIELQDQSEVQKFVGIFRLRKSKPRGDIPQGPFYITDDNNISIVSWNIKETVLRPFLTSTLWKQIGGDVRNQLSHILCSVYVATDMVSISRRILGLETEYFPLCPWFVCSFCHPQKLGNDPLAEPGHDCYGLTIEEALEYMQQEGVPKEISGIFSCKDHEPPSADEPQMQRRKRGIKGRPIATLEEALKLVPKQPIGATLVCFEELFQIFLEEEVEKRQKTYYGPRTKFSEFRGYHAVLIMSVEERNGEIVAFCKMSNGTKVGDEGYVWVSLSTMYLVLGVSEDSKDLVKGDMEPLHLLSDFVALDLEVELDEEEGENEDKKDDEKEDKKRKERPEEKPEDKQYPHVSKKHCSGHA